LIDLLARNPAPNARRSVRSRYTVQFVACWREIVDPEEGLRGGGRGVPSQGSIRATFRLRRCSIATGFRLRQNPATVKLKRPIIDEGWDGGGRGQAPYHKQKGLPCR